MKKGKIIVVLTVVLLTVVICAGFFSQSSFVIPFEITKDNAIVIKATVNNHEGKYLLDTGWHNVVTTVNIDSLPAGNINKDFRIFNKSYQVEFKKLAKIKFGNKVINTNAYICNYPTDQKSLAEKLHYDGIIGLNVFDGYYLNFSFTNKKVIISKKKPTNSMNSLKAKYDDKNNIITDIIVDEVPVHMVIDTGCSDLMRFPESVIRNNSKIKMQVIQGASLGVLYDTYYLYRADLIKLFDTEIKKCVIDTNTFEIQQTLDGGYGFLGLGFLQFYNFTLDLTKKGSNFDLYYQEAFPSLIHKYRYPYPMIHPSGLLSVVPTDNGFSIDKIIKNSQIDNAGIKPGTQLIKVNGINIKDTTNKDWLDTKNMTFIIDNQEKVVSITQTNF